MNRFKIAVLLAVTNAFPANAADTLPPNLMKALEAVMVSDFEEACPSIAKAFAGQNYLPWPVDVAEEANGLLVQTSTNTYLIPAKSIPLKVDQDAAHFLVMVFNANDKLAKRAVYQSSAGICNAIILPAEVTD